MGRASSPTLIFPWNSTAPTTTYTFSAQYANTTKPCGCIPPPGIVYQLLSRFVRLAHPRYESSDARIRNALRFIDRNPGETIALSQLADAAHMSRDHFIRMFYHEVGVTPIRYITERKMLRARLQLASTSLPVKDIAASLGYSDFSYFSRIFRKETLLTPLQYRASFNRVPTPGKPLSNS